MSFERIRKMDLALLFGYEGKAPWKDNRKAMLELAGALLEDAGDNNREMVRSGIPDLSPA